MSYNLNKKTIDITEMRRAKTKFSTMLMLTLLAPMQNVKAEVEVEVNRSVRPEDCTENST